MKTIRLPLLALPDIEAFLEKKNSRPPSRPAWPEVSLQVMGDLPEPGYAVRAEAFGAPSAAPPGSLLIFGFLEDGTPDKASLFLIGRRSADPVLRHIVRRESDEGEAAGRLPLAARATRRKSFMTPTPLHIPGSRVSPIPGYTHASLYLRPPGEGGPLEVLLMREVLWVHPMIGQFPFPGKEGSGMER